MAGFSYTPAGSGAAVAAGTPLSRLTVNCIASASGWPAGGIAPIGSGTEVQSVGGRFVMSGNVITVKAGGRVRLTGPQGMFSESIGFNRHHWALAGTTARYAPAGSTGQQGFAPSAGSPIHLSPMTAILEFTPAADTDLIIYSADSSAGFRFAPGFGVITCEELPTGTVVTPHTIIDTLKLPAQPTPTAEADTVIVFGQESAGRVMAAQIGPTGIANRLQPMLGTNRFMCWQPNGAGNTASTQWGGLWTLPPFLAEPMADTPVGRIRKARVTSGATAGGGAGIQSAGAFSLNSGFHTIGHFSPFVSGATASRRFFAGMAPSALTNISLSSYPGMGVHADTGQNTLMARGVNGVETDLGADFPANDSGAWYRIELFCKPLGTDVGWRIEHMITGAVATGTFTGAQVPAAGALIGAQTRIVTTSSSAQIMTLGIWSIETDL
jgi:hypothetical protein